jgi:hypothetical protein
VCLQAIHLVCVTWQVLNFCHVVLISLASNRTVMETSVMRIFTLKYALLKSNLMHALRIDIRHYTSVSFLITVHNINDICRSWWPCGIRCIWFGPLEHWDRGFEPRSRHECMLRFFCVVLSCVGNRPCGGSIPRLGSPIKMSKTIHGFRSYL